MHPSWTRVLASAATAIIIAVLLTRSGLCPVANPEPALAAQGDLRWYRGNIHTHTLWSDGDDYPEMVALWYKEHGYDFLCFTDHNTLLENERWTEPLANKGGQAALDKLRQRFPSGWIDERTSAAGALEVRLKTFTEIAGKLATAGQFLLIQGEEVSDSFGKRPIHMNASNLRERIPPLGGESVYDVIQRTTDVLVAQRERTGQPMLIHLNHPNFGYGVTAEDFMRVRGESFFEVYNGHPSVYNSGDAEHVSTERMWDIVNTMRLTEFKLPLMYGLAVDDGHNYHNIPSRAAEPGRGWVQVLARDLTPASLIDAFEAGRFYATSGVRLQSVEARDNVVAVVVEPEAGVDYTIEFVGTRRGFDRASEPVLGKDGAVLPVTRRYSADIGRVLKTGKGPRVEYQMARDDLYVRARVTSSKRHPNPGEPGEVERAWTQPVRGPGAEGR